MWNGPSVQTLTQGESAVPFTVLSPRSAVRERRVAGRAPEMRRT